MCLEENEEYKQVFTHGSGWVLPAWYPGGGGVGACFQMLRRDLLWGFFLVQGLRALWIFYKLL